ncbi:MAG: LPXTG cell wall anchor domain-containing protein [Actinomycetota bacterium]
MAALAVAVGVGQAASAQYDISAGGSPTTPGGETQVAVNGCQPGEQVTVNLPGFTPPTQTVGTNGEGNAFVSFDAPDQTGTFPGTAECGVLTTNFSVTVDPAPPPTTPSGGLPDTGSSGQGSTALIAGGLLAVGLALFAVSQVRRRQTSVAA